MSEKNMNGMDTAKKEKQSAPVQAKAGQKKKKRRIGRISVLLAAVLLAIALLFGVIFGYAFGRKTGHERLKAAQSQIDELADAVEESSRNDDVFEAATDPDNEEALSDLAGEGMEAEGNELLGGDELVAEADETESAVEPVVVAEFNGGKIMSDEAAQIYEEQIALYAFAGYTEEEISGDLMDEVLTELVTDRVLRAKAAELGLDTPSPEDEQELAALAQEDYDETVGMVEDLLREDGAAEDGIHEAAIEYLKNDEGVTYETVLESSRQDWWMGKLYDETVKDVTVSDEDVQAVYADLVETQQESFDASREDYEFTQMNGDLIVYNPAGYRAVRELLVALDEDALSKVFELNEQIEELNEESGAEEAARLEAELAECYTAAEADAQAALEQLRSGADFDEVVRKYDPDSMFQNEELQKTGYSICEDSVFWPQNAIDAAMALQNVGDLSEPIRVENGVAILMYAGEVPEGSVPLENVREAIREELLESTQYGAYKAQVDAWMQAADPKYYPERMQ